MTRGRRLPREQCTARRRDGQRCEAQAIEGGEVCRVHGGSAPQVALAARRIVLQEQMVCSGLAWQRTGGSIGALSRAAAAQLALETFDDDVRLIRMLQHAARQPVLFPDVQADLMRLARLPFGRWHGCDKVIGEQLERVARRLEERPCADPMS